MITFAITVVVMFLSCRIVAYLAGQVFRQTTHRRDNALQQAASAQPSETADPAGQWTSVDEIQLGRLLGDLRDMGQRD